MEGVINVLQDTLKNKVNSFQHAVIEDLKKPAKCVADVAGFIPDMITKAGEAVAGAFDRIGNSAENMANKVAGLTMDDDGFPDIFAPFRIVYLSAVKDIQGIAGRLALGKNAPQILADPNMKPEKLLQDMLNTSESYKKIVDSPAFKAIFDKWIQNFAEVLDKTIERGRPKIEGVRNKLTGIIDETSAKVGNALTNSLFNVISAAIKSIPGVGAVVNVAALLKQTGAKVAGICEPPISKGGLAMAQIVNTAVSQATKAQCKVEELTKSLAHLLPAQKGGGHRVKMTHRFNNKKKIIRATKRVKLMLGKFTKKHRASLNYANKLKTRRYLY